MKFKPLFIISLSLIIISILTFFLVPNSLELFAFSGAKFFSGEFWRIITFSVTHVSLNHLLENIIAISVISFLGYEFGLKGKSFIAYFIGVSLIIAMADAFLFPLLIMAGASLGIYGVLGVLSIKGSNFIPKLYLMPLMGASIFFKYFLSFISCPSCSNDITQSLFHLSGFITGIFLFYTPRKFKKKEYILNYTKK